MMTWFLTIAIYKGTVNDPTTFRPRKGLTSPTTGPCSVFSPEPRLAATTFVTSGSLSPLLDGMLDIGFVVHSHISGVHFLTISIFDFSAHSASGIQFDTILVDYSYMRKFPTPSPLFTLDVVFDATCRGSRCVRLQHE